MGAERVTPQSFNEAAWNLGFSIRWKNDQNKNSKPDENEITGNSYGALAAQIIKIIQEGATGKHLKIVRTPKYIRFLESKIAGLASLLKGGGEKAKTQEALRATLRDRDMAYRGWSLQAIDFTKLSEGNQKVAWILLGEAFPEVEAIHNIQNDPNNPAYFSEIAATGNFKDYLHAYYSGGPWCQEIEDETCSSHKNHPKRIPNAGTWPAHFTNDDVEKLTKDADSEDNQNLLSNFVDRFLDGSKLKWRPLNANPALKPHLEKLSTTFKKAAAVEGIDPTLKTFLEKRADEFQNTTSAFPFFDGDLAWIQIKGGLDVTLGFYEVDDSALGFTGFMQGYVGPVDAKMEERGKAFQALAPEMEKALTGDMDPDYTPRDFSKGLPPLRFANLVGAGDPRVKYVPGGYYLPNIAPYGDTAAYKKVFVLNSQVARLEGVTRAMANFMIDPSQRIATAEDYGNFVVAHENAHGVGPRGEIKLPQPYKGALEEAKADQEGIASLPLAVQNGLMTQSESDRTCIAMLYGLLRGLSYGMSDSHGVGAFIEFSTLYNEKGIVETKEGFYKINFQDGAIYTAAKKVARRIEKIQWLSLTNPEAAKKEAEEWLTESKENLPPRMKNTYLGKLVKMPKDVFPWYRFKFSDNVVAEMSK